MLSWTWPYLFILIPVPLIVRFLTRRVKMASGAIRVPFYQQLDNLDINSAQSNAKQLSRLVLVWLTWCALVTSAAGPLWVGEPINLPQDRRDLMLAVDISESMLEKDMKDGNGRPSTRINAVKDVVGNFIEQRSSDRLGLILFGTRGFLQTPLTYDAKTVKQQLNEASAGFAGSSTAIGDAIGLSIKRLRNRPTESRVLILLTDGANTEGTEPVPAAEIAKEANIRIHTIGVGADSMQVRSFFGRSRTINPSAGLDEDTLKSVARITGGKYFRARNPDDLRNIYAEIDQLEPVPDEQTFRPTKSLAHWIIIIALLSSALLSIIVRRGN